MRGTCQTRIAMHIYNRDYCGEVRVVIETHEGNRSRVFTFRVMSLNDSEHQLIVQNENGEPFLILEGEATEEKLEELNPPQQAMLPFLIHSILTAVVAVNCSYRQVTNHNLRENLTVRRDSEPSHSTELNTPFTIFDPKLYELIINTLKV